MIVVLVPLCLFLGLFTELKQLIRQRGQTCSLLIIDACSIIISRYLIAAFNIETPASGVSLVQQHSTTQHSIAFSLYIPRYHSRSAISLPFLYTNTTIKLKFSVCLRLSSILQRIHPPLHTR